MNAVTNQGKVVSETIKRQSLIAALVANAAVGLTAEDLEALRVALTYLYVNRGYVTSGAILPDQRVSEGVITYRIVEGRLTAIDIQGNRWFRDGYLRDRLALAGRPPVDVNALQRRLQILLNDPRIGRLNADLRPGLRAGEALLDVKVEDRFPFKLWLDVNNHQSPAVGAERGFLTLEHQNLTGNGDVLTLQPLQAGFDVAGAIPVAGNFDREEVLALVETDRVRVIVLAVEPGAPSEASG